MGKYPIFSGLTRLCSQNLTTSNAVLPKQGNIGHYLKSGDFVTFDLDSKDIWLDIQVNCYDLDLVIFFEARVAKTLQFDRVIKYLTDIINQIIKIRNIDLKYDLGEIFIKKMHQSDENIAEKHLQSTILCQESLLQQLQAIDSSSIINEIFGYLDRCLIADFHKKMHRKQIKRRILTEMSREIESSLLDSMSSELPIRGLRVEEKKSNNDDTRPKHRRGNRSQKMIQTECSCEVF